MKPLTIPDLKVLIVEDLPEARALLKNMLLEIGVPQTFEAKNGKEALDFYDVASDFINLIICDWNMPGMTGLDFLRQVRSVNSNVPFLMVTGRSDMESVVEAKTARVDGYIRKPFSPSELEAKLRIIAARHRG